MRASSRALKSKKLKVSAPDCRPPSLARRGVVSLGFRLCLAEAEHAVAFLPLAALLEEFDALEALENIAFGAQGAHGSETSMLRHKLNDVDGESAKGRGKYHKPANDANSNF